jgi:hypothetical protein
MKYSLFSFTIFFELEEIIFEIFNICKNNINSVELATPDSFCQVRWALLCAILLIPHYCKTLATSASWKYKGKKSSWSLLWYSGWKVWRGVWGCHLSQTLQCLRIFFFLLQLFSPWLFVSLLNLSILLTKYSTGQECAAGASTISRLRPIRESELKHNIL